MTHAEVGAYLLGLWGIPAPMLRSSACTTAPSSSRGRASRPEVAVYAADILVGEQGGHPIFRTGRFDLTTLARLGLADRLEAWRSRCGTAPPNEQEAMHHG